MENTLVLQSTLTCPACGFHKEETMPTDACQYFYKCASCETTLNLSKVIVAYFVVTALYLAHQYKPTKVVAHNFKTLKHHKCQKHNHFCKGTS
jgi:hypothetical protein